MLGEGQRMTSIAAVLGISVKTVETYRSRLQQKLGIEDLAGLVRFAIRSGLISPEK
jgi:DNA-binding NarL/FixJ family response regulator